MTSKDSSTELENFNEIILPLLVEMKEKPEISHTATYFSVKAKLRQHEDHAIALAVQEARIKDTQMWIDSTKYKKEKVVLPRALELHLKELTEDKQ